MTEKKKEHYVDTDWLAAPFKAAVDRVGKMKSKMGSTMEKKETMETKASASADAVSCDSSPRDVRVFGRESGGLELLLGGAAAMISERTLNKPSAPVSTKTMSFRILRGAKLSSSIKNPYCRVLVQDKIVGETPVRDDTSDPVFGGSSSTFKIEGLDTTVVVIQVLDDLCETPVAQVSFKVSDIVCQRTFVNPNQWLELTPTLQENDQDESLPTAGRLEVCLLPAQIASLQAQPSTRVLAPGPEMDKSLTSYAVRKMVLTSCAPVTLHVYDVTNDPRIANVNYYTKALGAGGIFHAAVEIHGREYSFGGSNRNVPGIFACRPKRCPMHHYRESIFLGDCALSQGQVKAIIKQLTPKWMAPSYNLFHKNCCFFSRELAIELGVGTIPSWVYQLAVTAEPLEPYFNDYCNKRRAGQEDPKNKVVKPLPDESASQDNNRLVDHAMAARLQRSYRARRMSTRKSIAVTK